jgi:hypothetical protein
MSLQGLHKDLFFDLWCGEESCLREEIMDTVFQPIPQPRNKRRYRSAEERRRIVKETLVPGTSVAIVARAHGVNANQVFAWRGRRGSD